MLGEINGLGGGSVWDIMPGARISGLTVVMSLQKNFLSPAWMVRIGIWHAVGVWDLAERKEKDKHVIPMWPLSYKTLEGTSCITLRKQLHHWA